MRDIFETRAFDAAGRIGELTVPRADVTIETPALLPVINPHIQTVDPSEVREYGGEILITNSYILHQSEDCAIVCSTRGCTICSISQVSS